jgi:dethiobiotin synthetase
MGTKIVFITGTDTGVGKTLLTALLLCHLRARGARALALKPFCSGGRADAELLHQLQDGELTLEEINPFYFPEPVAPLISARKHHRTIPLEQVVQHIHSITSRLSSLSVVSPSRFPIQNSKFKIQNYLLIEGSGGLLVPLGKGYTVRDLISRLDCRVLVVSRNRLGTINHTLLTIQSLVDPIPHSALRIPHSALRLVLMDSASQDISSRSNPAILAELLAPIPLVRVPFLGPRCFSISALEKNAKNFQKTLARLLL